MVGVTTISFKVEDERLEAFLNEQENRSEAIREAIRFYHWKKKGVQDSRLTDQQRMAYQWLMKNSDAEGEIGVDVAITELSQSLSLKKKTIKKRVFWPLQRHGYLIPIRYTSHVKLVVRPPSAVEGGDEKSESSAESAPKQSEIDKSPGLPVDDPDEAADRLEELASGTPVR